ncbi:MAG TPA: DUF5678 domain-containing protein [Candidatus Nanoarchaeia archaeon]|nr:DUF5678 domain-containing protein [Candidatus Nanoarchaeia archaeon]
MVKEEQVLQLLNESESALDWFAENIQELKKNFDGEFVAFNKGKVMAHNKDMGKLLDTLKKENVDPSKVVIQFVSKIKMIL